MPFLIYNRQIIRVLVVLAITQLVGWGTASLPAVIGRQLAADLDMDIAAVFAGTSVFYLAMGLSAPLLAGPFMRYGARRVMMAGTLVSMPGFVLLAAAQGPLTYFAGWVCVGAAGSATLTTAGLIVLNEVAGRNAKSAIGALMLVTGLSNSLFWPTTAFLTGLVGWRGTCLVYAVLIPLLCLPLFAFGLPRRTTAESVTIHGVASAEAVEAPSRSTFYLLLATLGLYVFVTFGVGAALIELFKAEGLPAAEAISFGSMLGVIQVGARAIDFLGGGRWDGITTALVAGLALPLAMLLLMTSGGTDLDRCGLHAAVRHGQRRAGGRTRHDAADLLRQGCVHDGDLADGAAAQHPLRPLRAHSCRAADPLRQQRIARADAALLLRRAGDPGVARPAPAYCGLATAPLGCVPCAISTRSSVGGSIGSTTLNRKEFQICPNVVCGSTR